MNAQSPPPDSDPAQDSIDNLSQATTEVGGINDTSNNEEADEEIPRFDGNAYPEATLPGYEWWADGVYENGPDAAQNPDTITLQGLAAITFFRSDGLPFLNDYQVTGPAGRAQPLFNDPGWANIPEPQWIQVQHMDTQGAGQFAGNEMAGNLQGEEQANAEELVEGMSTAPERLQEQTADAGRRTCIKPWQKKDVEAMRKLKWSGFKFDDRFGDEDDAASQAGT